MDAEMLNDETVYTQALQNLDICDPENQNCSLYGLVQLEDGDTALVELGWFDDFTNKAKSDFENASNAIKEAGTKAVHKIGEGSKKLACGVRNFFGRDCADQQRQKEEQEKKDREVQEQKNKKQHEQQVKKTHANKTSTGSSSWYSQIQTSMTQEQMQKHEQEMKMKLEEKRKREQQQTQQKSSSEKTENTGRKVDNWWSWMNSGDEQKKADEKKQQ